MTKKEEPMLVAQPKSRGRRYAEIAAWSAAVFWLYFQFRVYIGEFISHYFSPSFQASFKHTPDYSLGFLPRVLSGQLLTFFAGGAATGPAAGAYFFTLHIITYGLLAFILGRLIQKAISAKNYLLAMFPLLIIFTHRSVWIRFFSDVELDTLVFLFALAAFFLVKNEKLMWFVPVCVCLGIMTSESFMLLFFPLILALQYYELIKSGIKRTRLYNLIATAASSFAMWLYMLWAVVNSEIVSKYSFTEAIAYLESKIGYAFSIGEKLYLVGVIYGKTLDEQDVVPSDFNAFSVANYFNPLFYVIALLFCAPILIFTLTIWRRHMKSEEGFWQKSPYMLFMLGPAIIFPAFFVFSDMDRLVSAVLFSQVLWLAYVFFTDGQNAAFTRLKEMGTGKYRWLLFAAVLLGVLVPLLIFRGPAWLHPWIDIEALRAYIPEEFDEEVMEFLAEHGFL